MNNGWFGLVRRFLVVNVIVVQFAVVISSFAAPQKSAVVTQGEYLRWLAYVRPDGSPFVGAVESDYLYWAQQQNLRPQEGWKPSEPLSREVFAQTLAQVLGVKPSDNKVGSVQALEKEGVFIPAKETVDRVTLVNVLDGLAFQSPTAVLALNVGSPIDGDNGRRHRPQPPTPPVRRHHRDQPS